MLNIARAVQGVGGAIMFATSVALIASAFQGRERGTAFGIYGAVLGGAVAVGPLVGGALTTGVGWRWIFFVNVPIGIVAVAVTLAKVQESRDPTGHKIDWIGVVTFSVSLFTLILALIRGNADGWSQPDDRDPAGDQRRHHGAVHRWPSCGCPIRCSTCRCSAGRP